LVRLASCPLSAKLGNGEYLYMEFTLEERGSKIWCVCQDVHCLHTLGTSKNLAHVGKGMYLYMTM
jgi:hypothetical protein